MAGAVIKAAMVVESLKRLRSQWIHPHFAGYLCLKRTATRDGRTTNLRSDFRDFHETFLRVPGASTQKPYLRPFLDEAPSPASLWLNRNLAGSYAPSSIRRTLSQVIAVTRKGSLSNYSFRDRHWILARTHLLRGKTIPVIDLVAVLYREYAVVSEEPSMADWVTVFREEFGYPPAPPGRTDEEFSSLYYDDSSNIGVEWLERLA